MGAAGRASPRMPATGKSLPGPERWRRGLSGRGRSGSNVPGLLFPSAPTQRILPPLLGCAGLANGWGPQEGPHSGLVPRSLGGRKDALWGSRWGSVSCLPHHRIGAGPEEAGTALGAPGGEALLPQSRGSSILWLEGRSNTTACPEWARGHSGEEPAPG